MKSKDNYLDYVFQRKPGLRWDVREEGEVVLHIRHKGFTHFIAEKLFDRPPVTHVHLEPIGSFIWQQIDGKRTVYEIGLLLREAFGDEAEPLYERLAVYMKQLEGNGLVSRLN